MWPKLSHLFRCLNMNTWSFPCWFLSLSLCFPFLLFINTLYVSRHRCLDFISSITSSWAPGPHVFLPSPHFFFTLLFFLLSASLLRSFSLFAVTLAVFIWRAQGSAECVCERAFYYSDWGYVTVKKPFQMGSGKKSPAEEKRKKSSWNKK